MGGGLLYSKSSGGLIYYGGGLLYDTDIAKIKCKHLFSKVNLQIIYCFLQHYIYQLIRMKFEI